MSIKIKDLQEKIDTLNDEDLMVIEDIEDTKKITLLRLRSAFSMDSIFTATKNMLLDKINSFIESHSTKYKELEDRNSQLEVICHNLENNHIHDAERIFELENRLVIQTDQMATLKADKDRLLRLILELKQDKESLSEEITQLQAKISTNETSITILKSQVKDLQLKSKQLKEKNEELQNLVTQYETESNENISDGLNDINTKLFESIEDLMAYIRYYHPDVDDIIEEV